MDRILFAVNIFIILWLSVGISLIIYGYSIKVDKTRKLDVGFHTGNENKIFAFKASGRAIIFIGVVLTILTELNYNKPK